MTRSGADADSPSRDSRGRLHAHRRLVVPERGATGRLLGLPVTLALALAALLPFAPALWAGFTFDDRGIITENPAVWADSPRAAWSTPYWPANSGAGLYRPWTTFSFWCDAKLSGHSAIGFHALNLLLHLGTVLLLHRLLRRLFPQEGRLAAVATLLFALHPLHSEAVVSIVGRSELWAAALGLLGWILAIDFTRRSGVARVAGSAAAFALALLSKESAAGLLSLPVLHLILDRWADPGDPADTPDGTAASRSTTVSRWMAILASWGVVLALSLLLRARVLGHPFALAGVSLSDNALAHQPAALRMAGALGLQWLLALRTLFPLTLVADASYPQIVPGPRLVVAGLAFLVAVLALATFVWRRRDRRLAWGIGIVLAGGLVTSNLLLAVGTIYAERLAYLPSAGSLLLLSVTAARLNAHLPSKRVVPALALAWGLFLAGRSFVRTLDWKDDLTLFRATTSASPRSAKSWTNLAVSLLERDRIPEALEASERALVLYPGYAGARETRGTALTRSGRAAEAVELLRPSLHETPAHPRSLIELGNAWLTLGKGAPAETAFAAAGRALPAGDARVLIGLASAYALQERWREAASTWRRAALAKPDDPAVQHPFAWSLWQAGAADSAETVYRLLAARDRRDAVSRNELAWFLARTGRAPREAVSIAREAFRLQPDGNIADTLLEALLAAGEQAAAGAWLDSLAADPPPALGPDALRALRERWEQARGSVTLPRSRSEQRERLRSRSRTTPASVPLPEERR